MITIDAENFEENYSEQSAGKLPTEYVSITVVQSHESNSSCKLQDISISFILSYKLQLNFLCRSIKLWKKN